MPFVTEELYQRLNRRSSQPFESICIATYPQPVTTWANETVEKDVKFAQEIIKAVRVMRAAFNLTKEHPPIFINLHSESVKQLLLPYLETIAFLSYSGGAQVELNQTSHPGCAVEIVNENCEVYMLIKGLVDVAAEIHKLDKKLAEITGDYEKLHKQTQSANYHKVPTKLQLENEEKLSAFKQEMTTTQKAINSLKSFM